MPPFGDKLRKQREKGGITLEDVALTTKIGTRFLRALEEEHFDQLPGGIFNRGFVRAYARSVGLDEDQTIADYLLASGEVQPKKAEVVEPAPVPGPKASISKAAVPKEVLAERIEHGVSSGVSNFPRVLAGSAIVVVALGLALWHFLAKESVGIRGASSTPPTLAAPTAVAPRTGGTQTAAVAPAAAGSSATAGSFTVLIKASEDSWISITADGKPIFEDTLEPSTEKSVEGHSEVVVKAGNMGGLEFSFNGKRLALPGEEAEVRLLRFDPNGLRPETPRPPADASAPAP